MKGFQPLPPRDRTKPADQVNPVPELDMAGVPPVDQNVEANTPRSTNASGPDDGPTAIVDSEITPKSQQMTHPERAVDAEPQEGEDKMGPNPFAEAAAKKKAAAKKAPAKKSTTAKKKAPAKRAKKVTKKKGY